MVKIRLDLLDFRIKKRTSLKAIILLILLVLFFVFYLQPIVNNYVQKLTNTAKHEEKVTKIEPPAITVCLKPIFKPSVFRKLGVRHEVFFGDVQPNITDKKSIKVQLTILTTLLKHLQVYRKAPKNVTPSC